MTVSKLNLLSCLFPLHGNAQISVCILRSFPIENVAPFLSCRKLGGTETYCLYMVCACHSWKLQSCSGWPQERFNVSNFLAFSALLAWEVRGDSAGIQQDAFCAWQAPSPSLLGCVSAGPLCVCVLLARLPHPSRLRSLSGILPEPHAPVAQSKPARLALVFQGILKLRVWLRFNIN